MLEILRCRHCPELAVVINGIRITSHKCAGQWTVVARLPYDPEVTLRAIGGGGTGHERTDEGGS
jgi:hypothetical protein